MCVYNFIMSALVEIGDRLPIDLNCNKHMFSDVLEASCRVCCSNTVAHEK